MARGVTPRVMDTRIAPPGLDKLPESVERHLGDLNQDWLLAADLIVASLMALLSISAAVQIIRHARQELRTQPVTLGQG